MENDRFAPGYLDLCIWSLPVVYLGTWTHPSLLQHLFSVYVMSTGSAMLTIRVTPSKNNNLPPRTRLETSPAIAAWRDGLWVELEVHESTAGK